MIAAPDRTFRETDMMIELEGKAPSWGGAAAGYAIAVNPAKHGARVLAPVDDGRVSVDEARLVPVSTALTSETALMIPLVVEALRAWDSLQLEIGAAAVVTQERPWAPLFELVASWYGAFPVRVGAAGGDHSGASDFDAVAALGKTLAGYPLVCAAELTGRSEVVDTLLEAIPPSTRLLFAGPRHDRFTIDYYVNVHRKGLHLGSTILSPSRLFSPEGRDLRLVDRATRLLTSAARAQACHAAIGAGAQPGAIDAGSQPQ
jgi:hypothetical protein